MFRRLATRTRAGISTVAGRGGRIEQIAQDLLDRTGSAGQFGEAQQKRIGDAAAVHDEYGDGARFRCALEHNRIEFIEASRQIGHEF